jgi:hypothetical protein
MTHPDQIQDDLHFVRQAIARRTPHRSPAAILWTVAIYVLIGYTLLDIRPAWASWFLGIGGFAYWAIASLLSRRHIHKEGEYDRRELLRIRLHWGGGIALAVVACIALAAVVPALRGPAFGQVLVAMIGVVYFLGGVHLDPQFLWLGPVLIAGGVCVGFVPHYGWTALGVVIALGLVVPTFFNRRPDRGSDGAGGTPVATA